MKKRGIKAIIVTLLAIAIVLTGVSDGVVPAAAAGVKLNKTSLSLVVGKSATLKVTGTTATVKWASANKKIATVSAKGVVKAKKVGKTNVTATVKGKKYVCKVTVKKNTASVADEEYERAISYGFVGKNEDGDAAVTERKLADMISVMLSKHDKSLTKEWNKFTKEAGSRVVTRDYGAMFLLYAAERMDCAAFTHGEYAVNTENVNWDALWNSRTWKYPLFDKIWRKTCASITAECGGEDTPDYSTSALLLVIHRVSLRSLKTLLEFDEKNSLRCADNMTVREAALAALRLYESVERLVEAKQLPKCSIDAKLIKQAESMPAVRPDALPNWHGTSMMAETLPWRNKSKSGFQESDVKEIADMGFNYVRLGYEHSDFVKEKDGKLYWNPDVLQNMDDVIGWCISYKIHVCLDMHSLPGYSSGASDDADNDIVRNKTHRRQAAEIWSVLAERYRDVPSNALSYNLINEPNATLGSEEEYAELANELIALIRKQDADKLIVSDGILSGVWEHACPSLPCKKLDKSIVQTIHLYPFDSYDRSKHIALQNWPYEHYPAMSGSVHGDFGWGAGDLSLTGSFPAGSEIVCYIQSASLHKGKGTLSWTLDGKKAGSYSFDDIVKKGMDGCTITKDGDTVWADFGVGYSWNLLTVTIPIKTATKQISFTVENANTSVYIADMLIKRPSKKKQTYLVPNKDNYAGFVYETGKFETSYLIFVGNFADGNTELVLAEDGSFSCNQEVEADMFDYESLRAYVKEWADWSKETGASVICNEFGIPISLPKEVRKAYMESVLSLFDEYNIPWALYTGNYNSYGPLVYMGEGQENVFPADHSYEQRGDYAVDTVLLEVLSNYMK